MDECELPVFLYDFNSPYAYLACTRVDDVLPVRPRWQPVALAFMLRAHDRSPWSFDEHQRPIGIAECERRARVYGLPVMRWPPGWPIESYSLIPLRAAMVAEDHGLLREFSRAAFDRHFVDGRSLNKLDDVLVVADRVGLDPDAVATGIVDQDIKDRLASATEAMLDAGAIGVPTVLAGGKSFWGDDSLELAAASIGPNPH